jgi:hypothetical protein
LSPEQYARARLGEAMARLQEDLSAIQVALKGPGVGGAGVAAAVQRRVGILGPGLVTPSLAPIPTPLAAETEQQLLYDLVRYGIKTRSYDLSTEVVAPTAISSTGNYYDAGRVWDSWIVTPSINAQISFSGPPNQNTPVINAGLNVVSQTRSRYIFYIAAPGITTTGTLSIRLARYADTPPG